LFVFLIGIDLTLIKYNQRCATSETPMPPKNNKNVSRRPPQGRKNKHKDALNPIPTYAVSVHKVDEVKTLDYSNGYTPLTDTGSALLLNGSIQALDSVNDRIGRKILMKRITVRFTAGATTTQLSTGTGYTNMGDTIRAILVYDKQANGAAASWSAIMNASGVTNAPLANRDQSTMERFMILADTTKQISAAGPNSFSHIFDIPCNLQVQYTSTNNGNITDIITGSVYWIIVDANFTANQPGTWSMTSRVEFIDA